MMFGTSLSMVKGGWGVGVLGAVIWWWDGMLFGIQKHMLPHNNLYFPVPSHEPVVQWMS